MPFTVKQTTVTLPAAKRGCHLITRYVRDAAPALAGCRAGLAHVFIQHTSASLTINENADPDVRVDMETWFNQVAPESAKWVHSDEGPDDMPAHLKATLAGASVTVPVTGGRLALGTWQGVWLCEHRDRATPRSLVITVQGEFD